MRVAFIGAGAMCREHLDALSFVAGVTAVGIYSRTKSKAKVLANDFGIPVVAETIGDLFAQTRADAVIIAVNEVAVEVVFSAALSHDWLILIEKPLGLDIAQTRRILKLSGHRKTQCFVALNRRQYSSVTLAESNLERDASQRFVTICDQEDPAIALASGRNEEVCRQWHFANSIHLVDLFFVFCRGHVNSVFCAQPVGAAFEQSIGHFVILFSSGDIGVFHTVWNMPAPWSVAIETAQKRLQLMPIEELTIQEYGSRHREAIRLSDDDKIAKPGFVRQIEELKSVFLKKTHNLVSLDQYCISAELLEQIFGQENRTALR